MSELNRLGLAEARDLLRKGEVTSVQLTEACLAAIEAADALNAFVHKTPEIALQRAEAADARIRAGDAPSMCGLPVGIKDLFCTRGVPSQAASRILEGFRPEYESTVSQNLKDSGAVMLGKLNMDEFAMGSSNETSCYGSHRHRHRRLDPPARRLYRHHRDQADLWALFALGHRRLCLLAGPGRADDQVGARCGDHAGSDVFA